MLVEGMSMRATSRVTGVSINTVTKLLIKAGEVCAEYHNAQVRDIQAKRVQCDEIWSFVYMKQKNVENAEAAPEGAGDAWTAIDADSKLIILYLVGGRDSVYAVEFMEDVVERLANRVQLTTDDHRAYLEAVEDAFGSEVDYAMLVKLYVPAENEGRYSPAKCNGIRLASISGRPDPKHISTSYAERQNLTMRMCMRRFTRLTNAFSKRLENHIHMLSLYFVHYNFCRIHKSLRVTPAMAAGIDSELRDTEWIVKLIEAREPKPGPRGKYRKAV